MPFTPLFLCCVAMISNFPVLFLSVEAAHDRDRTILTLNKATDRCRHLHAYSHKEERDLADWACEKAFLALDAIGANNCKGWRKPACRVFNNSFFRQCSCRISMTSPLDIKNDEYKAFRECAMELWVDELFAGGKLLPSERFREASQWVKDSAWRALNAKRKSWNSRPSYGGMPSTPYVANAPYGAVPSTSFVANTPYTAVPSRSYGANFSYTAMLNAPYVASNAYGGMPSRSYVGNTSNGGKPVEAASQYDAGGSNANVAEDVGGAGGKIYMCPTCGMVYGSAKSLSNHKKTHQKELQCKICNTKNSSLSNFYKHARNVHPGHEDVALGKVPEKPEVLEAYRKVKSHVCEKCGKRYSNPTSLAHHWTSHTESLICTDCGKNFSTRVNLFSHQRKKHSESKKHSEPK